MQPYQNNPYSPLVVPEPVPAHRGLAIAALVLGIVGACLGLIPILFIIAFICGILALIFGCIARKRGMGKAGIILGIIALALGVYGVVVVNRAVNDVNHCLNSHSISQINRNCN